jgi:hypothetical protein
MGSLFWCGHVTSIKLHCIEVHHVLSVFPSLALVAEQNVDSYARPPGHQRVRGSARAHAGMYAHVRVGAWPGVHTCIIISAPR